MMLGYGGGYNAETYLRMREEKLKSLAEQSQSTSSKAVCKEKTQEEHSQETDVSNVSNNVNSLDKARSDEGNKDSVKGRTYGSLGSDRAESNEPQDSHTKNNTFNIEDSFNNNNNKSWTGIVKKWGGSFFSK